ncbi:NADH-ubiquinone oxidoreductase-F iron-sulfur binding region domain-containing protein, partial [Clostridioides difficile]|uniref:NADH-ubiquinone oxidoreductase-F iron-sulfur binding region domain-containing protein n=1 Tax=Clostridioides difficile TaxID=1496 RepID=UPI002ED0AA45
LLEILTKITEGNGTLQDLDDLENLAETIQTASLCGLGKAAPNKLFLDYSVKCTIIYTSTTF